MFDNATEPQVLRPFLPVAGAARVIVTSSQRSVAQLGATVAVEVFSEAEALAFLAARTGLDDAAGARVRAGRDGDACGAVMDLVAVLSPAGVRRALLQAGGQGGLPGRDGALGGLGAEAVDGVAARLAGASLLTFSVDGSAVSAHRLVMRVIRENLAASDALLPVCLGAARLLTGLAASLEETWHTDRAATRDLIEQVMALQESSATSLASHDPASHELADHMIRLRSRAARFVSKLGDHPERGILIGERLVADQEQALGADHADTLASRNNLAGAYQKPGRTGGPGGAGPAVR